MSKQNEIVSPYSDFVFQTQMVMLKCRRCCPLLLPLLCRRPFLLPLLRRRRGREPFPNNSEGKARNLLTNKSSAKRAHLG
jgi:hypothetical protein